MSTGDDDARLQRQAGLAPYQEDSCIQERTTCKICVQVHAASVGRCDMVVLTRSSRKTRSSIDDRLYSLKVTIQQARQCDITIDNLGQNERRQCCQR